MAIVTLGILSHSNQVQFLIDAILPHVAFSRCHMYLLPKHFITFINLLDFKIQSLVSSFSMRQFGLKVGVSRILAQALYFAQASLEASFGRRLA